MKSLLDMRLLLDDAVLRRRVTDRTFSIVSSNCWGGTLYQQLRLPYTSPFVGLFLYPPCFVKMLENLRACIESPLRLVDESQYPIANEMRRLKLRYPIGIIGPGVELHFVHYPDPVEAAAKWNRRCQRINWQNLRVAYTERELSRPDLIERFDALPYEHKVCFASKPRPAQTSFVWIEECFDRPYVTDLMKYRFLYKRRFDVADWLNGGTGRATLWYRMMEVILCPRKQLSPFKPLLGEVQ